MNRAMIAAAVWALAAATASAEPFYRINVSGRFVDLGDGGSVTTAGSSRTVTIARATWDNYVDVLQYEVDCASETYRLVSATHYQNMTNGLNKRSEDQTVGEWTSKKKDKKQGRFVEFACRAPDQLDKYPRVHDTVLAAAARTEAIEMERELRDARMGGDDLPAALAGSF